eukprot:TRINITY_DN110_c0_g2_i1.p1 TRINITY_DN110_c0_g2~~TRINITY_DN110_c0_g2_i1.p1  ORF type:complete len:212 (+),score=22.03 TRINITY_DN110_c0_g2_i1:2-637(+)
MGIEYSSMTTANNNTRPLSPIQETIPKILLGYTNSSKTLEKSKYTQLLYTSTILPAISLRDYVQRLATYANLTDEALLSAIMYIDRGFNSKGAAITEFELHRLLFTSCVVSMKFLFDDFFDNEYYAEIGGITLTEMNLLEKDFLNRLDFRLMVTKKDFRRYRKGILNYIDVNKDLQTCYTLSQQSQLLFPCLLYTSPSPRDATLSRMPSSA